MLLSGSVKIQTRMKYDKDRTQMTPMPRSVHRLLHRVFVTFLIVQMDSA